MDMIESRMSHGAAELDGNIVVAGGTDDDVDQESSASSSMEYIDVGTLLEFAPLHFLQIIVDTQSNFLDWKS
eukprot:CAMPEP_0196814064 /NCGR_PEP_ID=MMETSP1362-20130617/41092_1 /TAXON_ID=163516 /ORGANISM="Leptocylindrus danicus, Strain CCMP1856" /LENGTH=71 /DNA_ID=CAMNT_0042190569 /DNA_START=670 /DNA_END=885 /DNA_ORIENTATION=-